MTPTVHCIRHGQGLHNLFGGNYSVPDPALTPRGVSQCIALREIEYPDQSSISLLMASPLCRTLHSATIVFAPTLTSEGKCPSTILAIPDAQETSDDPCDVGHSLDELAIVAAENNWQVDLSLVKHGWNVKTRDSPYSPASHAIDARARQTRLLIRQKVRELVEKGDNDVHIVLVTHGGFLHFLTNDWEDAELGDGGTGWKNCESRTYRFEFDFHTDTDQDAWLIETMESRIKRGKAHPMCGRETQPELFKNAMKAWGDHGLQRPDQIG